MKLRILGIVFLLLVVACTTEQQFVCTDGSTVTDPSTCPKEETEQDEMEVPEEEPEVVEETPIEEVKEEPVEEAVVDVDEQVQDMVDNMKKRVQSFSFVYVGPPENLPRDTYYVKGDKAKVEILKATDHKLSQTYTTIYLDLSKKTAHAFCKSEDASRCPDGLVDHGKVDFEKHYVRTPIDWMETLMYGAYAGNGPRWEQRTTNKIDFRTENAEGQMYVLDFYSLPAQIMLEDGSKIEFRDLQINTVSDKDVMPPQ